MTELTPRQAQVLEAIAAHFNAHGCVPPYREICDSFGFSSPKGIRDHILALARKGYLGVGDFKKSRRIRVLRLSDGTAVVPRLVPVEGP